LEEELEARHAQERQEVEKQLATSSSGAPLKETTVAAVVDELADDIQGQLELEDKEQNESSGSEVVHSKHTGKKPNRQQLRKVWKYIQYIKSNDLKWISY
jgi:hypothetical protein